MDMKEKKHDQILEAAMQCFARYGIKKVTLDDIAGVLGMKKTSLYYYYKNKEALFQDALEMEAENAFAHAQRAIDLETEPEEKILALVRAMHNYFSQRKQMLEFSAQALMESQTFLQLGFQKFIVRHRQIIRSILDRGIENKELQIDDPDRTVGAILKLVQLQRLHNYIQFFHKGFECDEADLAIDDTILLLKLIFKGLKSKPLESCL